MLILDMISSYQTKVFSFTIFFSLFIKSAFSTPSCSPKNTQEITWYSCNSYPERWYGISKIKTNLVSASYICSEATYSPENTPSRLFRAQNENDDKCLYNALKLNSINSQKQVLISADSQKQNVWNSTGIPNFWMWCDYDDDKSFCSDGVNMNYSNQNTKENGKLDGTDFLYHITAEELSILGNQVAQATIFHNARDFERDYGWTMLDYSKAAFTNDFYFACTIDCK